MITIENIYNLTKYLISYNDTYKDTYVFYDMLFQFKFNECDEDNEKLLIFNKT